MERTRRLDEITELRHQSRNRPASRLPETGGTTGSHRGKVCLSVVGRVMAWVQ